MGLLDPPGTHPYQNISMDVVDSYEHRMLSKKLATESIVMLKNKNNILPLQKNGRIAVIGPNANRTMTLLSNYPGCKTSPGGPIDPDCNLINPLQGLQTLSQSYGGTILYSEGCKIDGNDTSMIPAAIQKAEKADVVVFVGGIITCQESGLYCQEAEARDRVNVTLPGQQINLLKRVVATGKPVVLVIMSGSTVAIPWASKHVDAILQLWYPGEEGGNALASIIFGLENPSGRLSETIFAGIDQLPYDYLSMKMDDHPGRTHRYFTGKPLYPFGYGLSYDERLYLNLTLSDKTLPSNNPTKRLTISVTIVGINGVGGDEVVQLYTSFRGSSEGKQSIPRQELKGFKRVFIPLNKSIVVNFELSAQDLTLVDVDGRLRPIKGTYDVYVGGIGPHQYENSESSGLKPLHDVIAII